MTPVAVLQEEGEGRELLDLFLPPLSPFLLPRSPFQLREALFISAERAPDSPLLLLRSSSLSSLSPAQVKELVASLSPFSLVFLAPCSDDCQKSRHSGDKILGWNVVSAVSPRSLQVLYLSPSARDYLLSRPSLSEQDLLEAVAGGELPAVRLEPPPFSFSTAAARSDAAFARANGCTSLSPLSRPGELWILVLLALFSALAGALLFGVFSRWRGK